MPIAESPDRVYRFSFAIFEDSLQRLLLTLDQVGV